MRAILTAATALGVWSALAAVALAVGPRPPCVPGWPC
jgi:hypothetical protein